MSKIRPLHYHRLVHVIGEEDRETKVAYGEQSYLTDNYQFYISKVDAGWKIYQYFATKSTWQQVTEAGLPTAVFERRRDAVAVLEAVLSGAIN